MSVVFVEPTADQRLDEIYEFTAEQWGEEQADRYIQRLFERFAAIAARRVPWRALPPEFGVPLFYARAEHHIVYWRERGMARSASSPSSTSGCTSSNSSERFGSPRSAPP